MNSDTNTPESFISKHFDYLVIGGGTAGLVVAARLSESGKFNIGVLEAGHAIPENTPAVSVPGQFGEGLGTDYDWRFETTPQKQLLDRTLPWPRGKALGGSSALNFMTWNRPSGDDLDAWERLGCKGWGWNDMLPFYKKSENFLEPDEKSNSLFRYHPDFSKVHGKGGPVTVSFNKHSDAHQHWHKTLENAGVCINETHMSGSNTGAWTSMSAVHPDTATREYAATAYLKPSKDRKNLSVLTGTTVQSIIIEKVDDEWVAKGVQFEHEGSIRIVHASREVILCAGSVKSPQILELSGVGNPSILEKAGIETKVNNPNVGENLQDHLLTATIYEVDPSIVSPDDLRNDPILAAAADEEYKTLRTGLRTWLACSFAYIPIESLASSKDSLASLSSRLPAQAANARDLAIADRLTKPSSKDHGFVEYIFDVGNWNPLMPVIPGKKYATLLQILQYPFSRGSIHINPSTPTLDPIINPQYFENTGSIDLEVQILGAEFGQKILETEPLNSFVNDRVWPPKDVSKEEWKDWILENMTTDWHPVGTCAMGKSIEDGGVVDSRLRVFGVKGLRVVDASIMPLQISAHLQATVYAIGEKGASMILEDAGM